MKFHRTRERLSSVGGSMRLNVRAAMALLLTAACSSSGTLESRAVGTEDPTMRGPGSGGDGRGGPTSNEPASPGEDGSGGGPAPGDPTGNGSAPGPGGGGPAVPGPVVPAEDDPDFAAAPAVMHRLTRSQYENALRALLGDGISIPADLETDTPLHGFSNVGAAELTISPRAAEQFETAALAVATQLVGNVDARQAWLGCDPAAVDCLSGFFARLGRLAWRRPLESAEVEVLVAVAQLAAGELRDPWQGVLFGLSALLQSPDFLFRVERGEPDPENPGGRRYTSLEMASRLSFFLWDGPPDADLLEAGENGHLSTVAGVRVRATLMLTDPRAERALTRFFAEYVNLDRLEGLTKDPATFPQMTATLGASMRAELEALFRDVAFTRDADFGEVLTSRRVFVNGELASLYGLPPPASPEAVTGYDLPAAHPRGGLLGTAGIQSVYAHNTLTSPTLRGKFIMANLLCFDVPPPPAGVVTELPEGDGSPQTMRMKVERHRSDPTCNGCHQFMDPIGLAMENFDAIGAYRTTDNGLPIDPSGELGDAVFQGVPGLGKTLREEPDFAACLARRMYRHATGHLELRGEEPAVVELAGRLGQGGNRLKALAMAVVTSPGFRWVGQDGGE